MGTEHLAEGVTPQVHLKRLGPAGIGMIAIPMLRWADLIPYSLIPLFTFLPLS